MRVRRFYVSPDLASLVKCIGILESSDLLSDGIQNEYLPDEYFEIGILLKGHPLRHLCPQTGQTRLENSKAFFSGLLNCSHQVMLVGSFKMLEIKFYPWAIEWLTGYPSGTLRNQVIRLEDLFGPTGDQLAQRLETEVDERMIVSLVERQVRNWIRNREPVMDSLLRTATEQIMARSGTVKVEPLAGELGVSRRLLEMKFKAVYGISPKHLARNIRLRKAAKLLAASQTPSLTETAYACGYFDQSHFIRDFKAVTGKTPSRFFRHTPLVYDLLVKKADAEQRWAEP